MYTGILTLFRAYFSICTFRRGPQDLPAAAALLLLSLCLYGLSSVAMVLPARALPAALLAGCVDTGLLLAITWVLLHLRGVPARFRQTGTALTGTGFLFAVASLPLLYLRGVYGVETDAAVLVMLLVLLLVVWNIAVMAHILRNALSAPYPMGVLLAIGYIWLINSAMTLLTPAPAAT